MAYRLGEHVVYGELRNRRYAVCGRIVLRGVGEEDTVIHLDLTGNPGPDLLGKAIRFMPGEGQAVTGFDREANASFQDRQIGPTGTMTAQGWVRTLPCGVEEYMRRSRLGEPPPTGWGRRLYLEWYGQNGRTVIEIAGAVVEECVREPRDGEDGEDEGEWAPLPNLEPIPTEDGRKPSVGPGFTVIRNDGDTVDIETWTPVPRDEESCTGISAIVPSDLQRELDREAAAIDRAISGEDDGDDDALIAEMELCDYCVEHETGTPALSLLEGADALPPSEELSDAAVESQLKVLLGALAMLHVTLDVCEHCTPRDCYRLLRDRILPEMDIHEPLVGTGWVTHWSTWEYCPKCEQEMEEEMRDIEPMG